jgi:hypothetical protein
MCEKPSSSLPKHSTLYGKANFKYKDLIGFFLVCLDALLQGKKRKRPIRAWAL